MVRHKSRNLIHMARPKWKPKTPAQHAAAKAIQRATKAVKAAEDQRWQAIRDGHDAGLPVTYMAAIADIHRATVHRHLGEDETERPEADE